MNKINSIIYKYNKLFDNNNIGIKGSINESIFYNIKENNNFIYDYCVEDNKYITDDELKTNNIYNIWNNYKNAMDRKRPGSSLYLCSFYDYITNVASVFKYKNSYIIGVFSNGFFKPSHFSPATIREGMESIEELCKYNNIIFTVTNDLTNMLKKMGAYTDTSFSFPMLFRDTVSIKNIVTTNKKVLEVILKKMKSNEIEDLYNLNFDDIVNNNKNKEDKYDKYLKYHDKYSSFLESLIKEEYKNILKEIGDSSSKTYNYKQQKINNKLSQYIFVTDLNTKYIVDIEYHETKIMNNNLSYGLYVDFYTGDDEFTYTIENKGELYKVMATITNIIKDFINKINKPVDFISFVADSKRSKLYDKYLNNYNFERKFDKLTSTTYYFFKNKLNEGYIDDSHKEEDIQELIDIIDLDPDNPRMKKHIDKLKNEYNYEYVKPEIRYKQDINIVNQIINKRYNVKTTKGFEFTFITKKPDNKDLNRTVQIEMFDKEYNNIGHVGFNIDSFKKTIVIGAAKVFDDYKRKGIYSAVVDFIQQVADKYNLFITEKSRTDDAREFWQDRITNNKINNVNYNI